MKAGLVKLFLILTLAVLIPASADAKEKWIKVQTKSFNIVGNADEDDTRKLALKLEQFRAVLLELFKLKNDTLPVTVVVFKNDGAFKPFKPLYNGKPANVAGYFQQGRDENMIALNIAGDELRTIFHEYTHLLTSQNPHEWPLWLTEGIAEFYSTFTINKQEVSLGVPISNHVYLLRANEFMPFQQFIKVDHGSPAYNERDKQGVFYAQSWAFVHYLIMGNMKRKPQLVQFINLLAAGQRSDSAFNEAFMTDFKDMEKELRNYIKNSSYAGVTYDLNGFAFDKDLRVEAMSEAEAMFHLGNLLLHTNRPDEAKSYFDLSLALDANLHRAHEGLGFIAMRKQNYGEAKERFKLATERDSKNFLAHYYFAEALLLEAQNGKGGAGEITPEAAKAIIASLRRSIALNGFFPQTYYLLATAQMLAGQDLDNALQVIKAARGLAPQNKQYVFMHAQIQARKQDYKGAQATLAPLLASDNELSAAAKSLADYLDYAIQAEAQARQAGADSNRSAPPAPVSEPAASGQKVSIMRRNDGGRSLSGSQGLILAATRGDVDTVKSLLSVDAPIDARDSSNRTALICAAENGHSEVVRVLVAAKADINARDENGKTALISATISGKVAAVRALLELGADANVADNSGETAIVYAAELGFNGLINILKEGGADVNARTLNGLTALMYAANNGHFESVRALIAAGADLRIKNKVGYTALKYAEEKGHAAIVELLKTARP